MNGQVSNVQSEKDEPCQLGQVVVAQLQIEDDQPRLRLQRGHRMEDLLDIRELTENVQAVLLHATLTGGDLVVGGATLLDALQEATREQQEETEQGSAQGVAGEGLPVWEKFEIHCVKLCQRV